MPFRYITALGLIATVTAVLAELISSIITDTLAIFTPLQGAVIGAVLFIATCVGVFLDRRATLANEKKREAERRLRHDRQALQLARRRLSQLVRLREAGKRFGETDIERWIELQDEISYLKSSLHNRGEMVEDDPIDFANPPSLGFFERSLAFARRFALYLALPIIFGLVWAATPITHRAYQAIAPAARDFEPLADFQIELPPSPTPTATHAPVSVDATQYANLLTQAVPTLAAQTDTPEPTSALPTQTAMPTTTAMNDGDGQRLTIGRSVSGAPITAHRFGTGPDVVVLVGGVHSGFAPATENLAQLIIAYFRVSPAALPGRMTLYVIPDLNPDSDDAPGELDGRLNDNDVDLNRNWDCRWEHDAAFRGEPVAGSGGPNPLSEPEVIALADFILERQPKAVIALYARAEGGFVSPGRCLEPHLPSQLLAEAYGLVVNYRVGDYEEVFRDALAGDAANWIVAHGIPAISVLLPEYAEIANWESHLDALETVFALVNDDVFRLPLISPSLPSPGPESTRTPAP